MCHLRVENEKSGSHKDPQAFLCDLQESLYKASAKRDHDNAGFHSNQDKGRWPHLLNDGVNDAAKDDQYQPAQDNG